MTVLEVIQRSTNFLAQKGVESPRLHVELLLAHVLNLPRLQLYLNFERRLEEPELARLRDLIKRRAAREPLQHIVGSVSFCGYEMKTSPAALIPRPETELLAEYAWTHLASLPSPPAQQLSVLDFGTGTGCLAIVLALKCPQANIVAIDISEEALDLARENARLHALGPDRIRWMHSDSFSQLQGQRFDLIVANPPYIPDAEIESLAPEVRDHDPRVALAGGPDGLRFCRDLASQAPKHLAEGGTLMLECGDGQAPVISDWLTQQGWTSVSVRKDYTQRDRFVLAVFAKSATRA